MFPVGGEGGGIAKHRGVLVTLIAVGLDERGAGGDVLRVEGDEDADGLVLQELGVAEVDHRPQGRRAANRLGKGRIAVELRGIVGAAHVRESHRIHAQRGADGVDHREVVHQDAPIGGLTRFAWGTKAV